MKSPQLNIADFAERFLGKPLYPYQREVAEAILESMLGEHGRIITVMMARQMGKNQLSAVIEAYLLFCMPEGTIVKAAPTFTPQIINSRLRLLSLLDASSLRKHVWTSNGYIVGLAPTDAQIGQHTHSGPRVMFYSAGTQSNVVGATADLLLEIDEAQDVMPEKFDRDFRPMAAVKNATTVLYGTAWSDTTLLAHQRAVNLELEQSTGQRCHFEYDWRVLAARNPGYRRFVEQEIVRLGEEHPVIQTQYLLRPMSDADHFLTALRQQLLQGGHMWEDAAGGDSKDWYVAGMDVAGEERPAHVRADELYTDLSRHSKRDSTVITIGRVHYNEQNLPSVEVVHHEWWTGKPYPEQYAATAELIERWGLRSLVIDATGLGAVLASMLAQRFGEDRIIPFTFTRPSKSRLAYQLLALISSGRLKLYDRQEAPRGVYEECWKQLRLARYSLPGPQIMDFYVDPAEGHDDFVISLALLTECLEALAAPAASILIRPRRLYGQEGRF